MPNRFYGSFAGKLVKSDTVAAQIGLAWTGYVTGSWAYGFGTACSSLFIYKSGEMRARWTHYLRGRFHMAPAAQRNETKGAKLGAPTRSTN